MINCHAGKSPLYRGRNILNRALINDEKEFGITVHYVDEGIDTGDIILQRVYEITDEENYATLLDRAHTYIGIPGQVVGKGIQSFFIKTKDSMVEVIEYEFNKRIKIGMRLKSYVNGR